MKTLQLLRHAKSSWDEPGLDDHDRPLAPRGQKACKRMGRALRDGPAQLAHIYCSTALRARQTIAAIAEAIGDKSLQWREDPALYTFSADDLLAWCRRLDDDLDCVLLVGHNPAFTDLCNLVGDPRVDNLPTCAFVRIELPIEHWRELGHMRGTISALLEPKKLPKK